MRNENGGCVQLSVGPASRAETNEEPAISSEDRPPKPGNFSNSIGALPAVAKSVKSLSLHADDGPGPLGRAIQRITAWMGIGFVSIEDPDYMELCRRYRASSEAYRKADIATVLMSLDRDFVLVKQDRSTLSRKEFESDLREKFQDQIETDFREEPAHFVLRRKRAQIASRVYSRTLYRRDGRLLALTERGEHVTTWVKSTSGWKRERTRIRSHEQDISWVTEAPAAPEPEKRLEKFTS